MHHSSSLEAAESRHHDFAYVGRGVGRKEPIQISDDESAYGYYTGDMFLIPPHYRDDVKSVMIPRGLVTDRIEKLAMDIRNFYGPTEELHLICILKGSRGFFSHLVECLNRLYQYTDGHVRPPYMEHYVRIKSYVDASNTVRVNIMSDDLSVLKGKHVLIVEDIIDSGKTLKTFCRSLLDYHVQSLRVASLIEKRRDIPTLRADFVGFSCPSKFIAGHCIDYNEMFRDLDHVVVLNSEAIERYKK
jgi:hypoxanthine phosphoribosyltransferase